MNLFSYLYVIITKIGLKFNLIAYKNNYNLLIRIDNYFL